MTANIQTILFDLDDTLLQNEAYAFFTRYIQLLAPHLGPWMPSEQVMPLIIQASQAMMANDDPSQLLIERFWATINGAGIRSDGMEAALNRFYATDYEQLRDQTAPVPGAQETVRWSLANGYRTVIATAPLFPLLPIQRRLAWAGLGKVDFALITSCENMHYSKPNPAYYGEILEIVGCEPAQAIMVGNDLEHDMIAGELGIRTYWVGEAECPTSSYPIDGCGTIKGLPNWLETLS